MKHVPIRVASILALAWALAAGVEAQEHPHAKQVAAPAADILTGIVRLPDPADQATRSRAALIQVDLRPDGRGGWSFETLLPVPSDGPLALALLAPDAARWRLRVRGADGSLRMPEELGDVGAVARRAEALVHDLPGWFLLRYDLTTARAGEWRLHVDVPDAGPGEVPSTGFLIARDASASSLAVHAGSLMWVSDAELALVARLDGPGTLRTARALVRTEQGEQVLTLRDDGRSQDGAAGDGVFGALLPAGTRGEVRALVQARAVDARGGELLRGAQLHLRVLERGVLLDGGATTRVEDGRRLRIELGALPLGPPTKLHVSAEVWGRDVHGAAVPVCWLSRMLVPEEFAGEWRLPLFLDGRWLDVAGATPPLELRQVRVQDPDSQVVLDLLERLPLEVGLLPAVVGQGASTITPEMLMGPLPGPLFTATPLGPSAPASGSPVVRALMLVHGYCSGGAIWPAAHFSEPKLVFLDPNANRTHDQFALLMAQAGASLYSFGVVAHSQGGAAALHLYTYYASPLDRAEGPRRIQSVATPYQGTPLASLGGFACGVNDNMTPGGAATWLAGIPSWARAEVFYWTTSNSGSVCNFFTGLFLDDPEDGTIEMVRGQLPGATNMGHVVGWCHTTGMSNPANYTDAVRNGERNTQAAR